MNGPSSILKSTVQNSTLFSHSPIPVILRSNHEHSLQLIFLKSRPGVLQLCENTNLTISYEMCTPVVLLKYFAV